ncbi:MAG: Glu-tRNA(Gln) amidotransferase subunit GatD [Nanoarchaeota archaeon]
MKKNFGKAGDLVSVSTKDRTYFGTLIPSVDDDVITLKLDSGYNLGMRKDKIKSVKILKQISGKDSKKQLIVYNKNLPTISILHTGGTIASKVDYKTGGVVSAFTPEDLIEMFPELRDIANFKTRLIREMWSDDLRFKHFSILAREIEKEIKNNISGIIIGMGTDNLAVAAAGLSFALESCPVPVILVGAQRSSDRGSSDAFLNLASAALLITKTDFSGVAICMHENLNDKTCVIMPACKTRKFHTSRRDAFKIVNDSIIARVHYNESKVDFFKNNYIKKGEKLVIKDKFEEKVGLIRITVNMNAKQFLAYKGYKGLVIEGTGLGHTPLDVVDNETKEHANIKKALQELAKDTVLVMTSQCLFGRVNLNVYSKGRELQKIGVISGEDMLPETAFVKLSWLLGNHNKNDVKELIGKNLRGEINPTIKANEFLD